MSFDGQDLIGVAEGRYPKISIVRRKGYAPAIPTTKVTIWDGNVVYPRVSAAGTLSIVSTSIEDTNYAYAILTATGDVADGDTVTIGANTYTFQDILTNVANNVNIAGLQATSDLTLTADFDDADTVTLDTKTYTFQDTLTDVDGNVKIASDKATGTFTATADLQDGDTVTLDAKTYTFQNVLTDVDGNVHIGSETATGTLTLTTDLVDGDTITIGSKTYTMQDTLTDVDGNVHIAGLEATGTLTLTSDLQDGDTVTLDTKTYTMQDTLTDVDGNVHIAGLEATETLTLTADLQDGDTVTLDTKTYTFQDTLTDVDGNVKIAAVTQATGILTNTADMRDGETVVIDGKTYTFQDTLTDVNGNVKIAATVQATATLTLADNTDDNDTVTIGSQTYTIEDTLTDTADNVQRGATASDTIDNLIAAINDTGVEGTNYGTGTTVNADVTAAVGAGDTMDITAKVPGTVSNSVATTEASVHMSWDNATLTGGTDNVSGTLGNLAAAIDLDAGAGTKYATSMTELTSVTATSDATTLTVTAVVPGTVSNSIATTETSGQSSWGNATLTGGVDDADGTIDNFVAAITGGAGSGTAYAASMTTHTTVTAVNAGSDTMTVTAIASGTAGNSIATTETSGQASFGGATLSGGTLDADGTIDNLVAAITGGAGSGTAYAASMTTHTSVTAVNGTGDVLDVTALASGTAGNSIATTETSGQASFGGANLTGGTLDADGTIDNLVAAITGGAGSGTAYAASMSTNTDVTAVNGTGDVLDVTALIAGTADNSVATTETSANASWGNATLTGGTDDAELTLDNFVAAITGGAGSGTAYAASMSTHTTVTAVDGTGLTIDLTAINHGTAGNVATTETSGQASFGAANLTGGTDDADGTINNFVAAITGGAGSGTAYAASMTTHTSITASNSGSNVMAVTALIHGSSQDSLTTTETSSNASFDGATLGSGTGGTDDASGSLDNLIAAIKLTGTPGTDYAAATVIHPTATAFAGAGDTVNVYAKTAGTVSIATTDVSSVLSFNTATLTLGTGLRQVTVTGLDGNYDAASETFNLRGLDSITTSGSFIRQFDMIGTIAGSGGVAAGTITSTRGSDDISILLTGNTQTYQSNYTIPANKYGILIEGRVNADEAGDIVAYLTHQKTADTIAFDEFRKDVFQNEAEFNLEAPLFLNPKQDVDLRAKTGAGTEPAAGEYTILEYSS